MTNHNPFPSRPVTGIKDLFTGHDTDALIAEADRMFLARIRAWLSRGNDLRMMDGRMLSEEMADMDADRAVIAAWPAIVAAETARLEAEGFVP